MSKLKPTFSACLAFEKECQQRADNYLKSRFPDKIIRRPDYHGSHHDKDLQVHDVDVVVSNSSGWPNEIYISEKFRTEPWHDVLIEFYSDFEKNKEGWASHSVTHEHHWHYIHVWEKNDGTFVDNSFLRIVPTWAVRKAYVAFKDMLAPIFKDMVMNDIRKRNVDLMGYKLTLIVNATFGNANEVLWHGACAAIPLEFFEDIKAPIQEIPTKDYAHYQPKSTLDINLNTL